MGLIDAPLPWRNYPQKHAFCSSVFNLLDRETGDKIKKITSIFCICIMEICPSKKIQRLIRIYYMYWKIFQPEEFILCKYQLLNPDFYGLKPYSEPNPQLVWISTWKIITYLKTSLGHSSFQKLLQIPNSWCFLEFKHPRIQPFDRGSRYVSNAANFSNKSFI